MSSLKSRENIQKKSISQTEEFRTLNSLKTFGIQNDKVPKGIESNINGIWSEVHVSHCMANSMTLDKVTLENQMKIYRK